MLFALWRKNRIFAVPTVCAAGAVLFASGCGSGGGTSSVAPTASAILPTPSPSPSDGPVSATGRYKDLVFTATASKRVYTRGETVPLTITVQNTGSADHALGFLSDFGANGVVYSSMGQVVGYLVESYDGGGHIEETYTYPPGATKTAKVENWNQTIYLPDETIAPLSAGRYRLRFFVRAYSYDYTGEQVPANAISTDYLDIEIR